MGWLGNFFSRGLGGEGLSQVDESVLDAPTIIGLPTNEKGNVLVDSDIPLGKSGSVHISVAFLVERERRFLDNFEFIFNAAKNVPGEIGSITIGNALPYHKQFDKEKINKKDYAFFLLDTTGNVSKSHGRFVVRLTGKTPIIDYVDTSEKGTIYFNRKGVASEVYNRLIMMSRGEYIYLGTKGKKEKNFDSLYKITLGYTVRME